MEKVWVVHIQSESNENYYRVFKNKPTDVDILNFQMEKYVSEFGEEPEDEYFTDLMGKRAVEEVEIK